MTEKHEAGGGYKKLLPKVDGINSHMGCWIPKNVKNAFLHLLGQVSNTKSGEMTRLCKAYIRAADRAQAAGIDLRHNPPTIEINFL